MRILVGDVNQGTELAGFLGWNRGHLVAKTNIKGKVGTKAPIVLEIQGEKAFSKTPAPRVYQG